MSRPLTDWQDEIAAGMLEDLEEITGVDIGEMMADELEKVLDDAPDFEEFPVYEEPEEGEELDIDSDWGDTDDYFDELFDDLDINPAEEQDQYGDEGN